MASMLITPEIGLNIQKNKRKTFGFGKYYKKDRRWDVEIHIRELSIGEAGLGCALWDASIILSRCFYAKRDLFAGKKILEVGSGCGLPAIVSGLFASEVVASDYINKTVENLQYNIDINANSEADDEELSDEDKAVRGALRSNLANSTRAVLLDWDEETDENAKLGFHSFDIIMGTELVYTPNQHHHDSLKNVILRYLKPEGVVWFCQSDNRLDMPQFLELMNSIGFEVHKTVTPEEYHGNYQSRQVFETYKFYTFRRATTDPNLPNL